MEEEDPLLSSRRQPFSSQVNLRRAESAEEVVEFDYGVDDQSTDETHIHNRVRGNDKTQNIDVFTKPIKELMHQISHFAGAGRISRALRRANMTAILNAYVHLLSSTQSDFVWNRLPQQEKLIRTIVQKHKEKNAFAIDDVAVNTKVFNNLLRHLRDSKHDQSMFNLLRHHSLVRPSKVQPQSKTGEVKEQREVNNGSMKKTMKSINSKASPNATLDNNSSGGGKRSVLKLSGSQHYSKLNEIFNLIQKGLYSKSLETFLIATKVILNDYKENGDIEFYPSNIGTLLRLMMNMWTPNQDRLIHDLAQHWVASSIIEWRCCTTSRVLFKAPGTSKLHIENAATGYSVLSGKSFKSTISSGSKVDSGGFWLFEIKVLSELDVSSVKSCPYFHFGWILSPDGEDDKSTFNQTLKIMDSTRTENTVGQQVSTNKLKSYESKLGELRYECAFSLVKNVKAIVSSKEYCIKNADGLSIETGKLAIGTVIGCGIDSNEGKMMYYVNGSLVYTYNVPEESSFMKVLHEQQKDTKCCHFLFPCISVKSSKVAKLSFRYSKEACSFPLNNARYFLDRNITHILNFNIYDSQSGSWANKVKIMDIKNRFSFRRHRHMHIQARIRAPKELGTKGQKWNILLSKGNVARGSKDPVYDETNNGKDTLLRMSRQVKTSKGYEVGVTHDGRIYIRFYGSCIVCSKPSVIVKNRWYTIGVAVSYDPSRSYISVKFYVDNSLVESRERLVCIINYADGPLMIGQRCNEKTLDDACYWTGCLASLQVWKRLLHEDKMKSVCGRCSAVENDIDLLGYWKCDEGMGKILHDSAPLGDRNTACHGEIIGSITRNDKQVKSIRIWDKIDLAELKRNKVNAFASSVSTNKAKEPDAVAAADSTTSKIILGAISSAKISNSVVATSVMYSISKMCKAYTAIRRDNRSSKVMHPPYCNAIAIQPFELPFNLLVSLFEEILFHYSFNFDECMVSALALSILRIINANLHEVRHPSAPKTKYIHLHNNPLLGRIKSMLVALVTDSPNLRLKKNDKTMECALQMESSKLLVDFLEIFYPSKVERHTLLHGVLTNFKNSMGSESPSAHMDLVYQVNQSFIGAKHEMLFSYICEYCTKNIGILLELMPAHYTTPIFGSDLSQCKLNTNNYRFSHHVEKKETTATTKSTDTKLHTPIWPATDVQAFLKDGKQIDTQGHKGGKATAGGCNTQWVCAACTLKNADNLNFCEVCNTPRPTRVNTERQAFTKTNILKYLRKVAPQPWLKDRALLWSVNQIKKMHTLKSLSMLYLECLNRYVDISPKSESATLQDLNTFENTFTLIIEVILLHFESCKETEEHFIMLNFAQVCFQLIFGTTVADPSRKNLFLHDQPLKPLDFSFLNNLQDLNTTVSSGLGHSSNIDPKTTNQESIIFDGDKKAEFVGVRKGKIATHLGGNKWGSITTQQKPVINTGVWTWVFRIDKISNGRICIGMVNQAKFKTGIYAGGEQHGVAMDLRGKTLQNGHYKDSYYSERILPGVLLYMTYDSNSNGGSLAFGNYNERRSFGTAFTNFSQNLPLSPIVSLRDEGDMVTYVDCFFGPILEDESHGIKKELTFHADFFDFCPFVVCGETLKFALLLLDRAKQYINVNVEKVKGINPKEIPKIEFIDNDFIKILLPQLISHLVLRTKFDLNSIHTLQNTVSDLISAVNSAVVILNPNSQQWSQLLNVKILLSRLLGRIAVCLLECEGSFPSKTSTSKVLKHVWDEPTPAGLNIDEIGLESHEETKSDSITSKHNVDWLSASLLKGGVIGASFNSSMSDSLKDLFAALKSPENNEQNHFSLYTWLEENAKIHVLVRRWYNSFTASIKKILAIIIYFSGNSKLILGLSREIYRSFDKYKMAKEDISTIMKKIPVSQALLPVLSTFKSAIDKIRAYTMNNALCATDIKTSLEMKILFLSNFYPAVNERTSNELEASIAEEVARINERLLVFSMDMYNGKSKAEAVKLRQSLLKKKITEEVSSSIQTRERSIHQVHNEIVIFLSTNVDIKNLQTCILEANQVTALRTDAYRLIQNQILHTKDEVVLGAFLDLIEPSFRRTIYSSGTSGSNQELMHVLRHEFTSVYKELVNLLRSSIGFKRYDLQHVLMACCAIKIPNDDVCKSILNGSGVFQSLHAANQSYNDLHKEVPSGDLTNLYIVNLCQKLNLKTFYALASQISTVTATARENEGLNDMFRILHTELSHAVNILHDNHSNVTCNIEMFVGETLSFLLRFNQIVGCKTILTESKWLTLILRLLDATPAHIQRRILRLLRHVLPHVQPEKLQCMLPKSTGFVGASRLVSYFLKLVSEAVMPIGRSVKGYCDLMHPIRAATVSSEAVAILRSLSSSKMWKSLIENILLAVLKQKVDKKSFNESIYKDQMAVLAVLGGFFELLRPGGKVRIANVIDADKQKFTENLTGIVQQFNAKIDVVQVSLDKKLGRKKQCSLQDVIPISQVSVQSTLFSNKIISAMLSNVLKSSAWENVLEVLSHSKKPADKGKEQNQLRADSISWQDSIPKLNAAEVSLKNLACIHAVIKSLLNATANKTAMDTLFSTSEGKSFCQKLLEVAVIQTKSCGLNQLPLMERVYSCLMSRWYSQRRELSMMAIGTDEPLYFYGFNLPLKLKVHLGIVDMRKSIKHVMQNEYSDVKADSSALKFMDVILNNVCNGIFTIFIDDIDGKTISQEDLIYEATDEYIQSVLKVDSDINESAKAMGSSYAHNDKNMITQGWSEVGKQIKEAIKSAISNAEYDTKTILPFVPNFLCGVISSLASELLDVGVTYVLSSRFTKLSKLVAEKAIQSDPGLSGILCINLEGRKAKEIIGTTIYQSRGAQVNDSNLDNFDALGVSRSDNDSSNNQNLLSGDNDCDVQHLSQMLAMGFPKDWCQIAYDLCDGNVEESIKWILSNIDDLDANNSIDGMDNGNDDEVSILEGKTHHVLSKYIEDGMEEELTIDNSSTSRNRNNVDVSRVFEKESAMRSNVYALIQKELRNVSSAILPVGNSFPSFVNELNSIKADMLLEQLVSTCKKVLILNARKLLLTIICQHSLNIHKSFNIIELFAGGQAAQHNFFAFLRLVTSRFSILEWSFSGKYKSIRSVPADNISTIRSILAISMENNLSVSSKAAADLTNYLVEELSNILANAAHRKFAIDSHTEESYARMDDVETMKLPNIYFAEWITNVLLSIKHESKSKDFVAGTAEALKRHNQKYIEIFCIWTKALKSPSTSLKQKVFQILSSILQKALKLKDYTQQHLDYTKYLDAVPSLRIFSMAARRIYKELEDHPLYSAYSKRLVEFTGLLQLIKCKCHGRSDQTLREDFRGIEKGNYVLSMSTQSHIAVSKPDSPLPDKHAPWTAEFWIRRKSIEEIAGDKDDWDEDTLETIAFSERFRFHIRCSGLTIEEAKFVDYREACKSSQKKSEKKGKRRKKLQKTKGKAKDTRSNRGVSKASKGNSVCFEIVGWKPLSFEYEVRRGDWTHLALVARDGGGLKTILELYANGEKVGKHYVTAVENIQLPLLYIGSKENSFCGLLGEARYWRVARSPKEIKRDMVWKLPELPEATQETLLGFWRFDTGSGCFIEDLSKHITSTFIYNASWAEDKICLTSWKKKTITEKNTERSEEKVTCVGSWKRYGLKRVNGFWQGDDIKSVVFEFKISHKYTKKKSGFIYNIYGIIDFPDNGTQFRCSGTLLHSTLISIASKVEDEATSSISESESEFMRVEPSALDEGCKIRFEITEQILGAPELFQWKIGSKYNGTIEGHNVRGKWSNSVKYKKLGPLLPYESRCVFPGLNHTMDMIISNDGKKIICGPKQNKTVSVFIDIGNETRKGRNNNVDRSTVDILSGRLWEFMYISRKRSAKVVAGFAPISIDLKQSIEKQKECIAWNLRSGNVYKDGVSVQAGDTRHALYCSTGDILGFLVSEDTKCVYLFKNSVVVGCLDVNSSEKSSFSWKGLRPCISVSEKVTVNVLGFKNGFHDCTYRGDTAIPRYKKISSASEITAAKSSLSNHVKFCQNYTGYWSRGVPHGFGILHFPGGSISCKGNWKEGKMNGVFEHCQGKIESEFKKNFYPSVLNMLNIKLRDTSFELYSNGKYVRSMVAPVLPVKRLSTSSIPEEIDFIEDEFDDGTGINDVTNVEVNGSFTFSFDKLFVFNPSSMQGGVNLSDDLLTAKYCGGNKGFVLGNRGFSSGLHYWEVQCESVEWGTMAIGVSHRRSVNGTALTSETEYYEDESDGWGDYAFISYRCKVDRKHGQEMYGRFYNSGDTIGVILDMDRGLLAFIKDGLDQFSTKKKAVKFGVAHRFIRTGGIETDNNRMESQIMYPSFSLSSKDGNNDRVSLKFSKWISRPSGSTRQRLDDAIYAAMMIQNWKKTGINLPSKFLQESYSLMSSYRLNRRRYLSRAGIFVNIDPSPKACKLASGQAWKAGDRLLSKVRGEVKILGSHRGHIWYTVQDGGEEQSWYWTKEDVSIKLNNGELRLLQDGEEIPQDDPAVLEGIQSLSMMLQGQVDFTPDDYKVIMLMQGTVDDALSWIFSVGQDGARIAIDEYNENLNVGNGIAEASNTETVGETDRIDSDEESRNDFNSEAELEALHSVDFDTFVDLVQQSKWWTMDMDELIVENVNYSTLRLNVDPSHLKIQDIALCRIQRDMFADKGISTAAVMARFFVLLNLNMKIGTLLPLIDFSIERENLVCLSQENIAFTSSFGQKIHSIKNIIFHRVKMNVWNELLDATTEPTQPPMDEYDKPDELIEITINRIQASSENLKKSSNLQQRFHLSTFGQMYQEMHAWNDKHFRRSFIDVQDKGQRRAFYVRFAGEGVADNGGPYRALFQSACASELEDLQILSSNSVGQSVIQEFNSSNECVDQKHLNKIKFLGQLVGTAVRHGVIVPLNLSSLIWKPLTGTYVNFDHDLKHIDPVVYSVLNQYRKLTLDEVGEDMLGDLFDQFQSKLDSTKITQNNLYESLAQIETSRLQAGNIQLEHFYVGISSVLPSDLFCLFQAKELEALVCGSRNVDLDLLKSMTEYTDGYDQENETIQYFWESLKEMNVNQISLFLRFVSACERLPRSQSDFTMPFTIRKCSNSNPDERLPTAQTCFFELKLPCYTSKNICFQQLCTAIENSPMMDGDYDLSDRPEYKNL